MGVAPSPAASLQKKLWTSCLWPGLAPVCLRGAFSGLILAVGFAAFLNLLLVSTLLWTELVSSSIRLWGWLALGLFWFSSAVSSWQWLGQQEPTARVERVGNLFDEAMQHYLLAHWFEAERLLRQILERDERDAEAGLMLATLLRHVGRYDEALRRLEHLAGLDDARKWDYEIGCERRLIAEDQERAREDAEDADEAACDEPAPVANTTNQESPSRDAQQPPASTPVAAGSHQPAAEPAFAA